MDLSKVQFITKDNVARMLVGLPVYMEEELARRGVRPQFVPGDEVMQWLFHPGGIEYSIGKVLSVDLLPLDTINDHFVYTVAFPIERGSLMIKVTGITRFLTAVDQLSVKYDNTDWPVEHHRRPFTPIKKEHLTLVHSVQKAA